MQRLVVAVDPAIHPHPCYVISAMYRDGAMTVVGAESTELGPSLLEHRLVIEHIGKIRSNISELKDANALLVVGNNVLSDAHRICDRVKDGDPNVDVMPGFLMGLSATFAAMDYAKENKSKIAFHEKMVSTQGLAPGLEREILEILNKPIRGKTIGIVDALVLNLAAMRRVE